MKEGIIKRIAKKFWITRRIQAIYSLLKRDSYLNQVGWFKSIGQRFLNDKKEQVLPWFTYGAIAFLDKRLNKEMSVFEFGSGNSTIWWSIKVRSVVSCEHDSEWYSHLKPKIAKNVEYLQYNLEPGGDYSKAVMRYKDTFDIIVIDGRDRVNCAKNSVSALKSNGVIVWDNSEREKYTEGYDFLIENGFRRLDFVGMGQFLAVGWCTSIFYRSNNCLNI